jgi:hypothetical protein
MCLLARIYSSISRGFSTEIIDFRPFKSAQICGLVRLMVDGWSRPTAGPSPHCDIWFIITVISLPQSRRDDLGDGLVLVMVFGLTVAWFV